MLVFGFCDFLVLRALGYERKTCMLEPEVTKKLFTQGSPWLFFALCLYQQIPMSFLRVTLIVTQNQYRHAMLRVLAKFSYWYMKSPSLY